MPNSRAGNVATKTCGFGESKAVFLPKPAWIPGWLLKIQLILRVWGSGSHPPRDFFRATDPNTSRDQSSGAESPCQGFQSHCCTARSLKVLGWNCGVYDSGAAPRTGPPWRCSYSSWVKLTLWSRFFPCWTEKSVICSALLAIVFWAITVECSHLILPGADLQLNPRGPKLIHTADDLDVFPTMFVEPSLWSQVL